MSRGCCGAEGGGGGHPDPAGGRPHPQPPNPCPVREDSDLSGGAAEPTCLTALSPTVTAGPQRSGLALFTRTHARQNAAASGRALAAAGGRQSDALCAQAFSLCLNSPTQGGHVCSASKIQKAAIKPQAPPKGSQGEPTPQSHAPKRRGSNKAAPGQSLRQRLSSHKPATSLAGIHGGDRTHTGAQRPSEKIRTLRPPQAASPENTPITRRVPPKQNTIYLYRSYNPSTRCNCGNTLQNRNFKKL